MHKLTLIVRGTQRQAWNAAHDHGIDVETLTAHATFCEARLTAHPRHMGKAIRWFFESHEKAGALLFYGQD